MTLLKPLGLIALIGLIILILIYIIKPAFQQKFISSTFIWRLSLKYTKKKLPLNKLRNLLLIICQVLIVATCAIILTNPSKIIKIQVEERENILIIDSSSSMRATYKNETRFNRALEEAKIKAEITFDQGGYLSIIVADNNPYYLVNRATPNQELFVFSELDRLMEDPMACSFASSNIDKALNMSEEILVENPKAEITLITDTDYAYVPSDIKVVNVSDAGEWNAAILDVREEIEDGYYTFFIDLASYGRDASVDVLFTLWNVTTKGSQSGNLNEDATVIDKMDFQATVDCKDEEVMTLVFKHYDALDTGAIEAPYEKLPNYQVEKTEDVNKWIISYKEAYCYLDVSDSLNLDDQFSLYGGEKRVLKVQYSSTVPNTFFESGLSMMKKAISNYWDVQYVTALGSGEVSGFDLYIYEDNVAAQFTSLPEKLPTDGVILIVNPTANVDGGDFKIGDLQDLRESESLIDETPSPLSKYISADDIYVKSYREIRTDDYDVVWKLGNDMPMLLVKNELDKKIVLMPFSLHYSNLPIDKSLFPKLLYNFFDYFFPPMIEGNRIEVGEEVSFRTRGSEITLTSPNTETKIISKFPSNIVLNVPETYTATLYTLAGDENIEKINVTIPKLESNIKLMEEKLTSPYRENKQSDFYDDLILYFAIGLVSLLFLEWLLKRKEGV